MPIAVAPADAGPLALKRTLTIPGRAYSAKVAVRASDSSRGMSIAYSCGGVYMQAWWQARQSWQRLAR